MAKEDNKSKITLTVCRYIFGILMFFSPFIICGIRGLSFSLPIMGLLTPPLTFFFLPPIAAGVYFMFTRSWHYRLDIFLLIIIALCEIVIATTTFGGA